MTRSRRSLRLRRAAPEPVAPPGLPRDATEQWLTRLAERLDTTVGDLLPPVEDAIGDVLADPELVDGDELAGRRAAHALDGLVDELGALSAALRTGPPGTRRP